MAQCLVSAKLALPTALRSVFFSELSTNTYFPVTSFFRAPQKPHLRCLSTTNRVRQVQIETSNEISQSHGLQNNISEPRKQEGRSSSRESRPLRSTKPDGKNRDSVKPDQTSRDPSKKKDHKDKGRWRDRKPEDKDKKEPKEKSKPEPWQVQKGALDKKFPVGWNPPKKLSPDALEGIRHLHATAPHHFTTAVLAEEFKISPESIRRILKSKWRPSANEQEDRRKRWEKRHDRIWAHMAQLGLRKPTDASTELSDHKILYDEEKDKGKKQDKDQDKFQDQNQK
ncbi:hypothetical protein N7495_000086 [Penicillium taxi]|uniref:uncharacterized protein n=1 Tax=Penicillium taxi TaxID=168475 RepID=UPI002544FCBD|nr:uncharacterized protein N7495_000086 [Penicillium taxi]KAJ5907404.1 hypothetical protein N7495_000086 [Penicillium taxi]